MKSFNEKRVTYYSKSDLSIHMNLILVERILRSFDSHNNFDLNDIIELHHTKLYIDNNLYLPSWTDEDRSKFKSTVATFCDIITSYFQNINSNNVMEMFNILDLGYQPAFWELFSRIETFRRVSSARFKELMNSPHVWIREILRHKKIVDFFSQEIKEFLLEYDSSAEVLLSNSEEYREIEVKEVYLPKCLSSIDKEKIILKYLDHHDINLNYVRLITKSRDQTFKLSPKTRLKARQVEKELNDKILTSGSTWIINTRVTFSSEQEEPSKVNIIGNNREVVYSIKYFDNQLDDISLFHIFSRLFNYCDLQGRITLVSKDSEIDPLEMLMIRSKNEYLTGSVFGLKNDLSLMQLVLYNQYLKKRERSVESLVFSFGTECLKSNLGIEKLLINSPSRKSSYLEKNRTLIPEIESILKQFKLFAENGLIDNELHQLDSHSIKYDSIPSLSPKKYVYGAGEIYHRLKNCFFSDQSLLSYIEAFRGKYKNLYELLIHENVKLDHFKPYQKPTIENLIDEKILILENDGSINIKEKMLLFVMSGLYSEGVISYWHYNDLFRSEIDKMEESGLIQFKNTLFSEPEIKYLNYYMNKSEYTNGLDLRNKYVHGTNSPEPDIQENEYFIILKVLVLILLKIEDDLLINNYIGTMGGSL